MSQPIIENVRDGASDVWEATGDMGAIAKHSLLDRLEQVARVARVVRAFGIDDVLLRFGLQRRRRPWAALSGAFGAGVLVGAGVALTVGPATGIDVRGAAAKLLRRVSKEASALGDEASSVDRAVARAADHAKGGEEKVEPEPYKGNHDVTKTTF